MVINPTVRVGGGGTQRGSKKRARLAKEMKGSELTIIIPAYNEEASISRAVEEVRRSNPEALILAVDDGSTDQTGEILSGMRKKPRMTIIGHARNEGYGAALKHAFSHIKTPYVGFIDADLTYDPRLFPKLLHEVKTRNLDCAWSNRFGGGVNEMPTLRKIGNRFINLTFYILTGKKIKDCTSGQRVFRTQALLRLDYESLPDGLGFISALSKRIVTRKLRFSTLPLDYQKRLLGNSKQKLITGFLDIIHQVARQR